MKIIITTNVRFSFEEIAVLVKLINIDKEFIDKIEFEKSEMQKENE